MLPMKIRLATLLLVPSFAAFAAPVREDYLQTFRSCVAESKGVPGNVIACAEWVGAIARKDEFKLSGKAYDQLALSSEVAAEHFFDTCQARWTLTRLSTCNHKSVGLPSHNEDTAVCKMNMHIEQAELKGRIVEEELVVVWQDIPIVPLGTSKPMDLHNLPVVRLPSCSVGPLSSAPPP